MPARWARPFEPLAPLTLHAGLMGCSGLAGYFGVQDVAKPALGETFLVSAALGGVGSIAGQVARLRGARVVGIVGSEEKARFLEQDLGFDAGVNYRSDDFEAQLAAACPDGVVSYFDNVAGPILDLVLTHHMNEGGRVACCGAVSQYNKEHVGPSSVPLILVIKRASLLGINFVYYGPRFPQAERHLTELVAEGKIRQIDTVTEGLESAPAAMVDLQTGRSFGKRLVRVAPDPAGVPRDRATAPALAP